MVVVGFDAVQISVEESVGTVDVPVTIHSGFLGFHAHLICLSANTSLAIEGVVYV